MPAKATRTRKYQAANSDMPAAAKRKVGYADRGFSADPPSMAEPALRDIMQDPILQRLMLSDGVEPRQLIALLADARSRLR